MEKRRQSLGRSRRQSFGGFSELEQEEPAKRRRSISLDDESEIDPLNPDHLGVESWSLNQRPKRSQSFSHPPDPGDPLSERRLARARSFSHRRDPEDGDQKQRNRRTHSFSHQPLEEENDLEHQLCEERKEKEEYKEKYEQAMEENRLLKKKIGKCSTCSIDSSLSTILSKIGAAAAGYMDPADGREVFEPSSVGTKGGGIPSKKPEENFEAAAALIPDDGGDEVFEPSFETEEEGIPAKNLEKATEVGEPVPNVITEVFQTSSPPGNQESDITTIKLSKDEETRCEPAECGLCACKIDGQYDVKYCHKCDRFEKRERCDSFYYSRSGSSDSCTPGEDE